MTLLQLAKHEGEILQLIEDVRAFQADEAHGKDYSYSDLQARVSAIVQGIIYACEARYICKDDECEGKATQDAEALQEVGDPYCPICEGEMEPAA